MTDKIKVVHIEKPVSDITYLNTYERLDWAAKD